MEYLSNPIRPAKHDVARVERKEHSFVVMFAGRLAPEKNIELLIRAFVKVHSQIPQSCLWIAGEGELRANLERLAQTLGIAHCTQFFGSLSHEDLASRYVSCDVFVLPSVMETQGLVLMEAMSHAKPVIATTRIVSGPELIEDDVNGFLVDPENPELLAEKLLVLANDGELRLRLGNAGRRRADDFSGDKIISGLEQIYMRVLNSA
jgi:glycosyltransferase involved in cell wall biosynthesis